MHKVSVMMPAYNAALFIAEAIDSVLHQDYPSHELVSCDDGFTDKGNLAFSYPVEIFDYLTDITIL